MRYRPCKKSTSFPHLLRHGTVGYRALTTFIAMNAPVYKRYSKDTANTSSGAIARRVADHCGVSFRCTFEIMCDAFSRLLLHKHSAVARANLVGFLTICVVSKTPNVPVVDLPGPPSRRGSSFFCYGSAVDCTLCFVDVQSVRICMLTNTNGQLQSRRKIQHMAVTGQF